MWNKEDFRNSKSELIGIVKKKLDKGCNLSCEVTEMAPTYGIPLIVIYEFIIEDIPEHTEECERQIKSLKEFYGQ